MSLTAYIRYDNTGRIVPGGPVLLSTKPTVGNWQAVQTTAVPSVTLSGKLRAFIKLNGQNKIVASSLVLAKSKPATGKWIEVNATYEGPVSPTTTTTTSSSTTTSTTTISVASFDIHVLPLNFVSQDASKISYLREHLIVYAATGTQFGTPGSQFFLDQALTVPLSNNSNANLAIRRVGHSETYYYSSQLAYLLGNYAENLSKSFYIIGQSYYVDLVAYGQISPAVSPRVILSTNIGIAWASGGNDLSVGLTLYQNFDLTNLYNINSAWIWSANYTNFGFTINTSLPVFKTGNNNGVVEQQVGTILDFAWGQLLNTKVQSSAVPCNQFYPNGTTLAPGVTTLDVGVTIYSSSYSNGTWLPLSWPYLADETYIYSVDGNSVITSKQLC